MEKRLHLKGLNGLRAIAAVSVVLSHARRALPEFTSLNGAFDMANDGVTIFFTLSGFLITYLLFTEKEQGNISIRNFYMRRILRIWPLYFTYLAIAVLVIYINDPGKLPGPLPYYVFFLANIPTVLGNHLPHLSHYWTLGVEEQFYIGWPWLIKRSKNVLKAIIIFTIFFFILKLFFRFIYFESGNIRPLEILSVNRFEGLSIGGIAAILCLKQHRLFLKIFTARITEIACWLSLVVMAMNLFHLTPFLDSDLVVLVTIGLIINLSFNPKPLISLENRFFDFLGRISYSMYILHPLIVFYFGIFMNRFSITYTAKIVVVYAGVILLTVLFGWLSYEFLEKRFLGLKDRFSKLKTADSVYTT